MQFVKEFPEELKLHISVYEVVSRKVSLKKQGKEYNGLCPFHNEKTPSFKVNDQKGFYHCFGCGAHGDIITFTMKIEGLDFKEAVIKLANDYGIAIPLIKESEAAPLDTLARSYQLLEEICRFFESNLLENNSFFALQYLYSRGLTRQAISRFRLGFAGNDSDSLINHLRAQNFTEEELLASGVIVKNKKLYNKFWGRVIFPIADKKGRIIAFGGRSLGREQPKYLNSPETLLFKKKENLYNYATARKFIYEQKFVVMVEGYMDVISLANCGIENVVAPLGTAVSAEQLQSLFKISSDVVICLDGDEAGKRAMNRVIDLALPLITAGKMIRFTFLPEQMDPDDFIRKAGKEAMIALLRQARNLSEVLFDYEMQQVGLEKLGNIPPEKKAVLEAKLIEKSNLINNSISRRYFIQYYKNCLFNLGKSRQPASLKVGKAITLDQVSPELVYAANILLLLADYPRLAGHYNKHVSVREVNFKDEKLDELKERFIEVSDSHNGKELEEQETILNFRRDLEKWLNDKNISFKREIIGQQKQSISAINIEDLDKAKLKLDLLLLKYHHQQVIQQYHEIINRAEEGETGTISVKYERQKELFDYKTSLEKEILELENEV